MRKSLEILIVLFVAVLLSAGSAFAYGTEITIYDENGSQGIGSASEDNEAEPGMVQSQGWDLEGFFLDGTNLSMIGGYDFVNGKSGLDSGDLFIDIDGDAIYGDIDNKDTKGNKTVENTFGYDYVLDFDFDNFTYDVYELGAGSSTITSLYYQNQGSNPWRYADGGTVLATDVSFGYETGLSDADTGFDGWGGSHNAVTGLDLSFISSDVPVDFIAHFTMECGNDNLMGAGTLSAEESPAGSETPEPGTMLLLSAGLIGLAVSRKKFKKN